MIHIAHHLCVLWSQSTCPCYFCDCDRPVRGRDHFGANQNGSNKLTCEAPTTARCDPSIPKRLYLYPWRWLQRGQGPAKRMQKFMRMHRCIQKLHSGNFFWRRNGGGSATSWSEHRIDRNVGLKFQTIRSPSSAPDNCGWAWGFSTHEFKATAFKVCKESWRPKVPTC
jgi:hypothetical protein